MGKTTKSTTRSTTKRTTKKKEAPEGAIPKRIGNAEARLARLETAFLKHLGVDLDQVDLEEQAVLDAFKESHPEHAAETAPEA